MSDTEPVNKNDPPDELGFPDPPGPILYAAVNDAGRHAGYVWVSARADAVPRAGIVLTTPPSKAMQDALGMTALRFSRGHDHVDAGDWLDFLADTYTGANGIQVDVERSMASTVEAVYRAAGWVGSAS